MVHETWVPIVLSTFTCDGCGHVARASLIRLETKRQDASLDLKTGQRFISSALVAQPASSFTHPTSIFHHQHHQHHRRLSANTTPTLHSYSQPIRITEEIISRKKEHHPPAASHYYLSNVTS